jgi:hypothetical protein
MDGQSSISSETISSLMVRGPATEYFRATRFNKICEHLELMLADVVRYVWSVFGEDRLTTREVEQRLESLFDYHCPDDFAKTMTKLKLAGYVRGEVSIEKGGWVWWVDDECKKNGLSGEI